MADIETAKANSWAGKSYFCGTKTIPIREKCPRTQTDRKCSCNQQPTSKRPKTKPKQTKSRNAQANPQIAYK